MHKTARARKKSAGKVGSATERQNPTFARHASLNRVNRGQRKIIASQVTGTVKFVHRVRGFAFIVANSAEVTRDVYVQLKFVPGNHLDEGMVVQFDVELLLDGKIRARNIQVLSAPPPVKRLDWDRASVMWVRSEKGYAALKISDAKGTALLHSKVCRRHKVDFSKLKEDVVLMVQVSHINGNQQVTAVKYLKR